MVKKDLLKKYHKKTEQEYLKEKEMKRKVMKPKPEKKPEKKKEVKGYYQKLNGKRVKIVLINGEVLVGTLETTNYNKYEILLVDMVSGRSLLIPKHAIVYIINLQA